MNHQAVQRLITALALFTVPGLASTACVPRTNAVGRRPPAGFRLIASPISSSSSIDSAKSLSSSAQGFGPTRRRPTKDQGDGSRFWSVGEGWGVVSRSGTRVRLEDRYGSLDLGALSVAGTSARIDRKLGAGDAADLTLGG